MTGQWLEGPPDAAGPAVPDTGVAHIARVQDYWLGGSDHFPADREAGEEGLAAFPGIAASVRATRAFLARVVRYLAGEAGIRQFLDLGTGIPTADNTHEVAQAVAPECRIVYVDNDPIVLAHARQLLTSTPQGATAYLDADLRDVAGILGQARRLLDFSQPVAVMLIAVLQFIPDSGDPYGIVAELKAALPPGSHMAVAHPASDLKSAAMAELARRLNRLMSQQVTLRSRAEVGRFLSGLELAAPGVVRLPGWRPDSPEDAAAESTMWGGAGRKSA